MKSKNYTQFLTKEDKLDINFTQNRGRINCFSVNYSSLISGRWRHILRVDNCHGQPHRHTYHLHRKEFRIVLGNNTNVVFTWAKKYVIKDYRKIKENYLKVRPRNI
ncbi:MAG: hypothetical protein Q7K54_02185 [Candidatus Parcubacteria bacterium]|nr:hypothetical protein [Candidatus Parcubacteria bacterium]